MQRRTWILVGQTAFGLSFLAAWLWVVDLGAVVDTIRKARWVLVLLAIGVGTASSLLRAQRWRIILTPVAAIPLLDIWLISQASSLISFLIPLRTGELARTLFLKQRHKIPISASLPTVAVDRSLDLLAVLVIGAVGALSGLRVAGVMSTALALGAALFAAFAGFVVLAIFSQARILTLANRFLPRSLGDPLRHRLLGILQGLLEGFTAIGRTPRALIFLIGLSFVANLIDAAVLLILFQGLGTVVSPLVVMTGYALFAITFLIPSAPGYVGSMEAFGSLIFGALGAGEIAAASTIVLYHALNTVLLGLGGGLAIWGLGLRPQAAFRSVIQAERPLAAPAPDPQPAPD